MGDQPCDASRQLQTHFGKLGAFAAASVATENDNLVPGNGGKDLVFVSGDGQITGKKGPRQHLPAALGDGSRSGNKLLKLGQQMIGIVVVTIGVGELAKQGAKRPLIGCQTGTDGGIELCQFMKRHGRNGEL